MIPFAYTPRWHIHAKRGARIVLMSANQDRVGWQQMICVTSWSPRLSENGGRRTRPDKPGDVAAWYITIYQVVYLFITAGRLVAVGVPAFLRAMPHTQKRYKCRVCGPGKTQLIKIKVGIDSIGPSPLGSKDFGSPCCVSVAATQNRRRPLGWATARRRGATLSICTCAAPRRAAPGARLEGYVSLVCLGS